MDLRGVATPGTPSRRTRAARNRVRQAANGPVRAAPEESGAADRAVGAWAEPEPEPEPEVPNPPLVNSPSPQGS